MLKHVFRPGAIGTLQLPHRIVMGSMHLNLETVDDGGRAMAAFYAERVEGGAALIVTGGCAVSPAGAGGPGYGVIGERTTMATLSAAVQAVHDRGGRIALQLFHAGRYARGADSTPCLAPSAVPSRFSRRTPREMTPDDIAAAIGHFAEGARAARELGFDAVEVMGSEGYLINQFTAPLTNRRDDDWGGDADRRRRFPLAVAHAVRAAVGGDLPVLFRISGADLVERGTPAEDVAALAVALAGAGADALSVGVGWHESPVPTVQANVPPGTWAATAATVKRALRAAGLGRLPVIAANRFNRLAQAEEVLASSAVDFVAMARPFLADPGIVAKSAAGRPASVNVCIACNEACIDRSFGTERVSCLVNPRAGYEWEFRLRPARGSTSVRGRFAVIGAGIAGLEAARTLAGLGHHVQVYEAEAEPGGQFRLAARVPGKADFAETIHHHVSELRESGVALSLGRRVDHKDLPELRACDGVVLATGVIPARPQLPGLMLPHVLDYSRAFEEHAALGARVAVIGGGGIAVDLAHLLSADPDTPTTAQTFLAAYDVTGGALGLAQRRRREVTLMRRTGAIGQGIGPSTRWVVLRALRSAGVRMLSGLTYREITPDGVLISDADGDRLIPADHVVLAAGQQPAPSLAPILRAAGVPFVTAGGAAGARGLDAVRATAEGLRAAVRIAKASERRENESVR